MATLFARHGQRVAGGRYPEPVNLQAHALQCAHLAQQSAADESLVAAALLHDIGHLVAADEGRCVDDPQHDDRGADLLAGVFGPGVTEPVRLHVQAKRYLVGADHRYRAQLTPAAMDSLMRQGGPLSAAGCALFEDHPFADVAIQLRRWDDRAHQVHRHTPPLPHFLLLLRRVATRHVLLRHARERHVVSAASDAARSVGAGRPVPPAL